MPSAAGAPCSPSWPLQTLTHHSPWGSSSHYFWEAGKGLGSTALGDFTLRRPCRKHFEKAKHRLLDPHVGHRDTLPGPTSDVGCPSWGVPVADGLGCRPPGWWVAHSHPMTSGNRVRRPGCVHSSLCWGQLPGTHLFLKFCTFFWISAFAEKINGFFEKEKKDFPSTYKMLSRSLRFALSVPVTMAWPLGRRGAGLFSRQR